MTREEAVRILKYNSNVIHKTINGETDPNEVEALDMAISALEHPERNVVAVVPCGDTVSRQAVLELIADYDLSMGQVVKSIHALPSVTPQEPRKGHWMLKRTFPTKLYDEPLNEYKCSECYREIRCTESQLVNYPYCHCGVKMIEPQERSDKE